MIRRPPRSTLSSSSAASDVYKRQNDFIYYNQKKCTRELSRQLCIVLSLPSLFLEVRVTPTAGEVIVALGPARVGLHPWRSREYTHTSPVPVSYTHLRAHETPEHLVCRLLLEKKKQNKNHDSK
eukprot:TRINITY_DN34350_c0_g1_i1.p1 TRINITY_DN34350_c0_g1~~TRINITY_DN34350_c0_g1_i1.p1  ORF type:complete len:124 (+),score=20.54 TRINITY_DN34350_c0_g1_i1:110-481(+)